MNCRGKKFKKNTWGGIYFEIIKEIIGRNLSDCKKFEENRFWYPLNKYDVRGLLRIEFEYN